MEAPLEKGRGVSRRDGRGEGGSKGLGALPSLGQVAVTCWPEIPSGITEQVLDPWFLVLLGSQVPSFRRPRGCLSCRDCLETWPVPSVPEELGAGVPGPHKC